MWKAITLWWALSRAWVLWASRDPYDLEYNWTLAMECNDRAVALAEHWRRFPWS